MVIVFDLAIFALRIPPALFVGRMTFLNWFQSCTSSSKLLISQRSSCCFWHSFHNWYGWPLPMINQWYLDYSVVVGSMKQGKMHTRLFCAFTVYIMRCCDYFYFFLSYLLLQHTMVLQPITQYKHYLKHIFVFPW